MRVLVHDYAGHPFQVGLSVQLAHRGHEVIHAYYAEDHGPKGWFDRPYHPSTLHLAPIAMGAPTKQTRLLARRFNQITYGRLLAQMVSQLKPDVVISGNTPTEAQQQLMTACSVNGVRFVYWVQDIYSVAISTYLGKWLGPLGNIIGSYYRWLDRAQYRRSDAIVVITEDFADLASRWGGDPGKVSVIENWGALDEVVPGEKDNHWSRQHRLHDQLTFIYSGTLGRKHNPELLMALATEFPNASVVVVGQGVGVDMLAAAKRENILDHLLLLPLQPASELSAVLASADVLVATIETDAGAFAVPSKVLTYLCAGRPILLAAPKENLAARTVLRAKAGFVVDPGDYTGFLFAARQLQSDPALRKSLGSNGRAYAERMFDLQHITDQFERILTGRTETSGQRRHENEVPDIVADQRLSYRGGTSG
jgi:colanic acid biosynthesis glycosyl transferase WcaI